MPLISMTIAVNAMDEAAEIYGYQPTIRDAVTGLPIPNTVTRKAFIEDQMKLELKAKIKNLRHRRAAELAVSSVVEPDIT